METHNLKKKKREIGGRKETNGSRTGGRQNSTRLSGDFPQMGTRTLRVQLCNVHLALPVTQLRLELVVLCFLVDVVCNLRHLGAAARLDAELLVVAAGVLLILHNFNDVRFGLGQNALALSDFINVEFL